MHWWGWVCSFQGRARLRYIKRYRGNLSFSRFAPFFQRFVRTFCSRKTSSVWLSLDIFQKTNWLHSPKFCTPSASLGDQRTCKSWHQKSGTDSRFGLDQICRIKAPCWKKKPWARRQAQPSLLCPTHRGGWVFHNTKGRPTCVVLTMHSETLNVAYLWRCRPVRGPMFQQAMGEIFVRLNANSIKLPSHKKLKVTSKWKWTLI